MEPVVVIGGGHILRAGNDEMLVVAKPEAVEHHGIEPVYHHSEGIGRQHAAQGGRASVDIPD